MNEKILESNPAEKNLFDILVLSNNSPESGVRIVNSAKHYGKVDPTAGGSCFSLGGRKAYKASQWSISGKYRARGCERKGFFQKQARFLPVPCTLLRVPEHTQHTGSLEEGSFGYILCTKGSGRILHGLGILRQLLKKQSS